MFLSRKSNKYFRRPLVMFWVFVFLIVINPYCYYFIVSIVGNNYHTEHDIMGGYALITGYNRVIRF